MCGGPTSTSPGRRSTTRGRRGTRRGPRARWSGRWRRSSSGEGAELSRRGNPYRKPDRFSRQAKDEGYAARSVYKLQEIQRRQPFLRAGQRVVDLGCAPGSWFVYAAEVVGPSGRVVGVDLDEPVARKPWTEVIVGSALDVAPEALIAALGGPADVVLSDMAPRTTGDPTGDHFVQIELATRALDLGRAVLAPGGAFVCKVFDGQDAPGFVDAVRRAFASVRRFKPEAVRGRSREFFVLGTAKREGGEPEEIER